VFWTIPIIKERIKFMLSLSRKKGRGGKKTETPGVAKRGKRKEGLRKWEIPPS